MSKKVRMARKAAATGQTPVPAQSTPVAAPQAATATPEAKAPKAPKAPAPVKYVSADVIPQFGRKMRVAEFQDYTFSVNDADGRQRTDEELCAEWQAQFPRAVTFTPFHVKGARRDYNAAKHSRTFAANGRPVRPSVEYVIHGGARVRVTDLPKPEPKAPAAKTPAPAAPKATAA